MTGRSTSSQTVYSPVVGTTAPWRPSVSGRSFFWIVAVLVMLARPGGAAGDYLTVAEADRIREAQELFPRTVEYLSITTSRVQEIGRRLGNKYEIRIPGQKERKPKKAAKKPRSPGEPGEEENPLLFFSLPDLVRGMSQSLRAIMTNIDERFQFKRESPRELVRALQLLKEFSEQSFLVLDHLDDKAHRDQDEGLLKAVDACREDLAQALEGAKQGLDVLQGSQK